MNTFEKQLTDGVATYIHSYSYIADNRSFELVAFHDPDSPRDFRTLRVNQIEDYQDILMDDFDPELIEGIIGADQNRGEDGKIRTLINTDLREITFKSNATAIIQRA